MTLVAIRPPVCRVDRCDAPSTVRLSLFDEVQVVVCSAHADRLDRTDNSAWSRLVVTREGARLEMRPERAP